VELDPSVGAEFIGMLPTIMSLLEYALFFKHLQIAKFHFIGNSTVSGFRRES
jgi:hypothetical protein